MGVAIQAKADLPIISFKPGKFVARLANDADTRRFFKAGDLEYLTGRIEHRMLVVIVSCYAPASPGNNLAAICTIEFVILGNVSFSFGIFIRVDLQHASPH